MLVVIEKILTSLISSTERMAAIKFASDLNASIFAERPQENINYAPHIFRNGHQVLSTMLRASVSADFHSKSLRNLLATPIILMNGGKEALVLIIPIQRTDCFAAEKGKTVN